MWDNTTRIAAGVLAGIFLIAACGAKDLTAKGSAPSPSPTVSATGIATGQGCSLLTDSEVATILGGRATLAESPVSGGHWCSWKPAGPASITALELTTEPGEDRFDEAMGSADDAGDLHDADPALGPLGFTSDDGQSRTVGWVVEDQSVVLSLTAGEATIEDLVVVAKAIDSRLRA